VDVFAPQSGDIVTIMYDMPHGEIHDTREWEERRQMAEEWRQEIARFSVKYGLQANPVVRYDATGGFTGPDLCISLLLEELLARVPNLS
jgi:hypothetical protein